MLQRNACVLYQRPFHVIFHASLYLLYCIGRRFFIAVKGGTPIIHYRYEFSRKKIRCGTHKLSLTLHYSRRIFFISPTFTFNLYFLCFVVDELSAFIIVVYNLKLKIKTCINVRGTTVPSTPVLTLYLHD